MAKNADKLSLTEPELFWRDFSQLTTESSFSRLHLIFLDIVVSIRLKVEVRSDIFPELFRSVANFKTSSSSAWVEKVSVTVVKISGTRVQLLSSFLKKFNDNIILLLNSQSPDLPRPAVGHVFVFRGHRSDFILKRWKILPVKLNFLLFLDK